MRKGEKNRGRGFPGYDQLTLALSDGSPVGRNNKWRLQQSRRALLTRFKGPIAVNVAINLWVQSHLPSEIMLRA